MINQRQSISPIFDAPTQIRPYLYVGGIDNARDRDSLLTLGITHILSAAAEYPPASMPGIRALHIALYDRTNERTTSHLPAAIAFIEAARQYNGRVLVHCQHGVSRSITLVLAYLMQTEHLTLTQAFSFVRALRASIEPNPSFLGELRALEESIFGEILSTHQLTVLDPGPLDLASPDAQSRHILQNCLAAASKVDAREDYELREQHAATSLERDSASACQVLVTATIMQSYEAFAGTSERDQVARQSLQRILGHLCAQNGQGRQAVNQALGELLEMPAWQDFKLDVPFADTFVAELKACIAARLASV